MPSDLIARLTFNFYCMIASEHLLETACATARNRGDSDLADYYASHLEEERGHAQWLAEDLASAGVRLEKVRQDAAILVGSVYYLIHHLHPASLLGYMFLMEGLSIDLAELERLEARYGKKLLRTLRYHAEHDPEHAKELEEFIDSSSAETREAAAYTARHSAHMLGMALARISQEKRSA
jgi:rubrerythrin